MAHAWNTFIWEMNSIQTVRSVFIECLLSTCHCNMGQSTMREEGDNTGNIPRL